VFLLLLCLLTFLWQVSVRAYIDVVGPRSAAVTASVTVDTTPPTLTAVSASARLGSTALVVDWAGVFAEDVGMALVVFEIAVGNADNDGHWDVSPWQRLPAGTERFSFDRSLYALDESQSYIVGLRAINSAGLSVQTSVAL
jgi:hypothetical protein